MYISKFESRTRPMRARPFLAVLLAVVAFVLPALSAYPAAQVSDTIVRDPFLDPASGTIAAPTSGSTDSGADASDHFQEAVKLSSQGAFTLLAPRVGDSLDYVLRVEWEETQVPVVVLAPDSLSFAGFRILGQATQHKKLASGSEVRNRTEFIYRLRASTQGMGKASSLRLRYLTGISTREEAVFVPNVLIDILPAPVRILDALWFKLLIWVLGLAGAMALAFGAYRMTLKARAGKTPQREDFRPEVAALKSRLRSAQNSPDASREILLAMEGLAIRFLRAELDQAGSRSGSRGPVTSASTATSASPGSTASPAVETAAKAAPMRFEPLLSEYLARNAALQAEGGAQDWDKLRELFRHARFAGGHKEPHELQDAFKTFRKCLKIKEEGDHD